MRNVIHQKVHYREYKSGKISRAGSRKAVSIPRNIIIWMGTNYTLDKGENLKETFRDIKDGTLTLDEPDYLMATDKNRRLIVIDDDMSIE